MWIPHRAGVQCYGMFKKSEHLELVNMTAFLNEHPNGAGRSFPAQQYKPRGCATVVVVILIACAVALALAQHSA